jgi:hypothetical protein
MSNRLFEKGRQLFLGDNGDFNTDTIKAALVTAVSDVGLKIVTGASNASPIVITSTSHGFANGDIVVIGGVGGNLAANGTWKVANQAANTFELQTLDSANSTGSAAYTSGGYAVNLTLADFRDDIDGATIGTDQTLTSPTITNGVADAADPTWTSVTGAQVIGVALYKSAGSAATDRLIHWIDGRIQVVVAAQAAALATSIFVERLAGGIPSGTTIVFSNGASATLSAAASAGARTLSVNALAAIVSQGATADVAHTVTNQGLPITPNGGNITLQFDTAGIFVL